MWFSGPELFLQAIFKDETFLDLFSNSSSSRTQIGEETGKTKFMLKLRHCIAFLCLISDIVYMVANFVHPLCIGKRSWFLYFL